MINQDDVKTQLKFLEKVNKHLDTLAERGAEPEAAEQQTALLLADFFIPNERKNQFQRRLQFGLRQYYLRHYMLSAAGSSD